MVIEEKMKNIVIRLQQDGADVLFIRSSLKEYLQSYVLNFVYENPKYSKSMVFSGGTCLRKVYGINRLSEDLDFDLLDPVDLNDFCTEIDAYFKKKHLFQGFSLNKRPNDQQITLKFKILDYLNLASGSESPLLHVKIDLSPNNSEHYKVETKLLNDFDFSYLVKHYDISTLFAGKILAILNRSRLWGAENMETIKGRDYFDLLWFLQKEIIPNYERLFDLARKESDVYGEMKDDSLVKSSLIKTLDEKVELANTKFKQDFERDLLPFISNSSIIEGFVDSYWENYSRLKGVLLGRK
ncbi:MAG: hypothetical protein ACD_22C00009G0005 [uncultured bacterium]|uniref:Nucleotidyl transferase AbiEii/AbiGii toxin family protein n=1 Tax=candidate division WWE3 bacterium RBG_16_37_10 TaxID=1802610 RepID=A0A1F4V2V1_UNCKA|nr:MAG: hypothetical protein ACD_22C00009G0005 [uncultured bacterium]OGC51489.1 MAG: hypothetical protein A2W32_02510 [candidate division WWE3 bacterium RBG_16_37_10]